jgi:hypothetical protein
VENPRQVFPNKAFRGDDSRSCFADSNHVTEGRQCSSSSFDEAVSRWIRGTGISGFQRTEIEPGKFRESEEVQ